MTLKKKYSALARVGFVDDVSVVEQKADLAYQYASEAINAVNSGAIIYGVEKLRSSADPSFTTIGSALLHQTLPIHQLRRNVVVNQTAQIQYYTKKEDIRYKEDGTPSVIDGSDGNDVAVVNPHCWVIFNGRGSSGLYSRWIIGDRPFTYDGDIAIEYKRAVISADNCTLDASNRTRCVLSNLPAFAGTGSGTTAGGLNYPRTNISRYNAEIYANNKSAAFNNWLYLDLLMEAALLYIEFKTTNLKSIPIFSNTGTGWSSAEWASYNNYCPVFRMLEPHISISQRPDLAGTGQLTGSFEKQFIFNHLGAPITKTVKTAVYRGRIVRNGLWNHISGVDIIVQSEANGGLSKLYVTYDPAIASKGGSDAEWDIMIDYYQYAGNLPRVEDWSKTSLAKNIAASELGGGETTYGCKYFWTNIPAAGVARRCFLEGGSLSYGSYVAFGSLNSYYAPSLAYSHIGVGFRANVAG